MSTDKDYEAKILRMVVNEYLNQTTFSTEKSIKALEDNPDEAVWELATKIYKESGHKVELCMVRDIVDLRITDWKYQLEKLEIEEKARAEAEEKARAEAERKAVEAKWEVLSAILQEIGDDVGRAKVFVKLWEIISEQLSVYERAVTLNSSIANDLGADELDELELRIAVEEEFDIEISDDEFFQVYNVESLLDVICIKVLA